MTEARTPKSDESEQLSPEYRANGRKALGAAMWGFFVDMYDVYLPVVVLAPAIGYFTDANWTPVQTATLTALIFASSLIGRPLGSIIFGAMGDKLGRRRTTIIVAGGFSVSTGLIALMPGHATLGVWAPIILVVLRLLDGVFLGGEYTAANPLAMEYAPQKRRGLYGSLLNIGYPAALAVITLITIGLLAVIPSGAADSAYSRWGWRIPFAVGFVISAAMFWYYLRSVPESELWTKMTKVKNPLRTLFTGQNLRRLGVAFVVGSGAWLTLDGTVGAFSSHMKGLETPVGVINVAVLIAAIVGVIAFPLIGAAGQQWGRRRIVTWLGILNVIITPIALVVAFSDPHSSTAVIAGGSVAIFVALLVWAMITAYIMEMFPTEIRSSGYGIAYSLPSVIPAFYGYYMVALGGIMPYRFTPLVIVVIGGALLIIGAALSKDRRHVHLADVR
ncbi:MFS transporter [Spelaeicoccus albus]|uniref:MFS family permease n=1 Tax=Spelaeicoccus albus TaxID=1280376 RepID=A0A7Z0D4M5_9MICO|nr:MFS transporter [Spelaeicoccus albus]NYI68817.1 MFS family permease [Spelaeicoccus albus]